MKSNRTLMVGLAVGLMALTAACEKKEAEVPAQAEAPAASVEAGDNAAAAAEQGMAAAPEAKADGDVTLAKVGEAAPAFSLTDLDGKAHNLADYKGKIVVLEWTNNECPYVVRHYQAKTMQRSFEALGGEEVVWLAVDSTKHAEPEKLKKWRADEGFSYPVLTDKDGKVGKSYGAKTTPHMYVIDAEGKLRYSGAIDDDDRGKVESPRNYVLEAVKAIKAGEEVAEPETKPYGCSVKYAS